MTPDSGAIMDLALDFLSRQSWYEAAIAYVRPAPLRLFAFDVLRPESPGLGRLILERGEQNFQLLVGWRRPADISVINQRREAALLGSVGAGEDQLLVFDALADDYLCLELLRIVSDGTQDATRVRRVSTLVSHASLVFDDRLFMKCYRVLEVGERTEVVTMRLLDEVGFNAIPGPVGKLHAHGFDLAFVREFFPSALEGRLLAFTSLRDLLAHASGDDDVPGPGLVVGTTRVDRHHPDQAAASAGGDLASESFRLGQMIASLHLAMREAFGTFSSDLSPLIEALEGLGDESSSRQFLGPTQHTPGALARSIGDFTSIDHHDGIRLHGELHLRRVMRAEFGWVVTGFSDDPLYEIGERTSSIAARTGSPIEDLADMCFSLDLVAQEALAQRQSPSAPIAVALGAAWVRRNQAAFLRGYFAFSGIEGLVTEPRETTDLVLSGYELLRRSRYDATFTDA